MKKILVFLLALVMLLGCAACGKKTDSSEASGAQDESLATAATKVNGATASTADEKAGADNAAPTKVTFATQPTTKATKVTATSAATKGTEAPAPAPTTKPTEKPTVAPTTKPVTPPSGTKGDKSDVLTGKIIDTKTYRPGKDGSKQASVSVYSGPGTEYEKVGVLRFGQKISIYQTKDDNTGRQWGKTAAGWVLMEYVQLYTTEQ